MRKFYLTAIIILLFINTNALIKNTTELSLTLKEFFLNAEYLDLFSYFNNDMLDNDILEYIKNNKLKIYEENIDKKISIAYYLKTTKNSENAFNVYKNVFEDIHFERRFLFKKLNDYLIENNIKHNILKNMNNSINKINIFSVKNYKRSNLKNYPVNLSGRFLSLIEKYNIDNNLESFKQDFHRLEKELKIYFYLKSKSEDLPEKNNSHFNKGLSLFLKGNNKALDEFLLFVKEDNNNAEIKNIYLLISILYFNLNDYNNTLLYTEKAFISDNNLYHKLIALYYGYTINILEQNNQPDINLLKYLKNFIKLSKTPELKKITRNLYTFIKENKIFPVISYTKKQSIQKKEKEKNLNFPYTLTKVFLTGKKSNDFYEEGIIQADYKSDFSFIPVFSIKENGKEKTYYFSDKNIKQFKVYNKTRNNIPEKNILNNVIKWDNKKVNIYAEIFEIKSLKYIRYNENPNDIYGYLGYSNSKGYFVRPEYKIESTPLISGYIDEVFPFKINTKEYGLKRYTCRLTIINEDDENISNSCFSSGSFKKTQVSENNSLAYTYFREKYYNKLDSEYINEYSHPYGIKKNVSGVNVKYDFENSMFSELNEFVSTLFSYFNIPWIYGSGPEMFGTEKSQVYNKIGSDCADLVFSAWRNSGNTEKIFGYNKITQTSAHSLYAKYMDRTYDPTNGGVFRFKRDKTGLIYIQNIKTGKRVDIRINTSDNKNKDPYGITPGDLIIFNWKDSKDTDPSTFNHTTVFIGDNNREFTYLPGRFTLDSTAVPGILDASDFIFGTDRFHYIDTFNNLQFIASPFISQLKFLFEVLDKKSGLERLEKTVFVIRRWKKLEKK